MRRFSKKDRVQFRRSSTDPYEDGEVMDDLTVDHNPTYLIKPDKGDPIYIVDVSSNVRRKA